jgi:periplasmic protein TonB
MADVLLIHVPEDQALAEGLTDTLSRSGLVVTLDPAHEAQAACVLVLWSPASIRSGPVRDLAIHAQRQSRLVAAKTAGCEAPLGFSKPAPHDLSAWGGDPNDAGLDPMFFAVDRLVCAARLAQQKIPTAALAPAPLVRAPAMAFAGAGAPATAPAPAPVPAPQPPAAPEPAPPPVTARAPEPPALIEPRPPVAPHRPEPTRSPPPVVAWIAPKPRPAPGIDAIPPGPIFREKPAPAAVAPPKAAAPIPAPIAPPKAPAPTPAPVQNAASDLDDEDDDWVEPVFEDLAPLPAAKPLPFGLERLAWRPITIVATIVLCGLTIYKLLPPPLPTDTVAAVEQAPMVQEPLTDLYEPDALMPDAASPLLATQAPVAPATPAVAPPPKPELKRPAPRLATLSPSIVFQAPPLAPTSASSPPPSVAAAPAPSATPAVSATPPRPQGDILWARRAGARDMADNYPPAAQDRNIAGQAVLDCLVLPTHTLACAVLSESPSNQGFGRAAVRISSKFQTAPTTSDGADAVGKRVRLPVRFQPPSPDRRAR